MKPFNDTQKKWVMAASLLAVLGLNVSAHHREMVGSIELASNGKVPSEILTVDGEFDVEYRQGEKGVIAILSPKTPEGQVCTTNCTSKIVDLDLKKMADNAKDMNIALLKQLNATAKVAEKPDKEEIASNEKEERESKREEKKRAEKKKDVFAEIKKDCDYLKEDADDAVACLVPKFIAALEASAEKDAEKDKKISARDAEKFFNSEIYDRVNDQLSAAADESSDQRALTKKYREILAPVDEITKQAPKGFESIRKLALDLKKNTLADKALEIKNLDAQISMSTNSYEKSWLMQEAFAAKQNLHTFSNQTLMDSVSALRSASSDNLVSRSGYAAYVSDLQNFQSKFSTFLFGSNTSLNTQQGISSLQNSTDQFLESIRSRNGSNNNGITNLGSISNRTGTSLSANSARTIMIPVQVQDDGTIIPGTSVAPSITIPSANNGVSFGAVAPIEAQQRALREALRKNLQQRQ
ncbi:MAG: hypothetical protein AAGB31_02915 [Bdellovibrio sp.]